MINAGWLAAALEREFLLPVRVETKQLSDSMEVMVSPRDERASDTFYVIARMESRFVKLYDFSFEFKTGNFAAPFIETLKTALPEKHKQVLAFTTLLESTGAQINFLLDEKSVSLDLLNTGSRNWKNLGIRAEQRRLSYDDDCWEEDFISLLMQFWGLVMALLPIDEKSEFCVEAIEGQEIFVETKRYGRSRLNREACIAMRGNVCLICGFNFKEAYGSEGDGYIQVHHILPVSSMKKPKALDPAVDLIPVCANCHAMLHRRDPPYTPEELKEIIIKAKNEGGVKF